jgi:hypothetical protein
MRRIHTKRNNSVPHDRDRVKGKIMRRFREPACAREAHGATDEIRISSFFKPRATHQSIGTARRHGRLRSMCPSGWLVLGLVLGFYVRVGMPQHDHPAIIARSRPEAAAIPHDYYPNDPGAHVQGRTLSPHEALAEMMEQLEALVLEAQRAQEHQAEECPPCVGTAACCGACACVHGYCEHGICVCEADWFGDSCELHVLSAGYFLPARDPKERLSFRQAQSHAFFRHSARLVHAVDMLQHNHACKAGAAAGSCRPLHVVMEGRGFGSWVHHMVGPLTHTLVC